MATVEHTGGPISLPAATDTAIAPERAGFWRRTGAFVVDFVIIAVLLQLIAILAFGASHGRVQTAGGVFARHCDRLTSLPAGLAVPFTPNFALHCTHTLFGRPTWNAIVAGRQTQHGGAITVVSDTFMLDVDNALTRGLDLDHVALLALLILRWAFDAGLRGSIGRRLCGIRLRAAPSTASDSGQLRIIVRYAVFGLPYVPLILVQIGGGLFLPNVLADAWTRLYGMVGTGVVALVAMVVAAVQIIRKRDAFYDRVAGTMVEAEPDTIPGARDRSAS
jgi:hypothetical protein